MATCNTLVTHSPLLRHQYVMTPEQDNQNREDINSAHFDFQKGLNRHAFFKVSDRSISDELVQNTFLKTWKYLVAGGKVDVMKSFLYHILNNLIVDEYRKHKTLSLDGLMEKGFEPTGKDYTEKLLNTIDGKTALGLIKLLPLKYQRVMRMRYIQDLSLKDMSLILGQTKNTIAVQAHRGLEKLRVLYLLK